MRIGRDQPEIHRDRAAPSHGETAIREERREPSIGPLRRLIGTVVGGIEHVRRVEAGTGKQELRPAERRAATAQFFDALGLGATASVDPARVQQVLADYFALVPKGEHPKEQKRALEIRQKIEERLASKGTLGEFVASVQRDLVERHAPLSQVLALGRSDLEQLTSQPGVRVLASQVAHHAFVLDTVVQLMVEDQSFAIELRRHFYHQRRARGITLDRVRELSGVFGAVKTATIDLVFKPIAGLALGLERTRKMDRLIPIDFWAWGKSGVPLNITEAMITGWLGRAYDNALAAFRLAVTTPKSGAIGGEHRELLLDYPRGWTELYESWNLLFVLDRRQSGLESPELLIAKLLIPAVTSVESDSYIYRRALALWTTIQTYLFVKDGGYSSPDLPLDRATLESVASVWGEINRKYSEALREPPKAQEPKRTRKLL